MPQTIQSSSKLASVVAAVAITFVVQGLLLKGFDQMPSESKTAVAADRAAAQTTAFADAVVVHTPG